MRRAARTGLAVLAAAALASLPLGGCLNFRQLVDECDGGVLRCRPDGGGGESAPATCGAGATTRQLADGGTAFCFNGFEWLSPLPQGNELRAVWAAAPNDVWAGGTASMLMHFDGTAWTSHQGTFVTPTGPGTVEGIVGTSSSNVVVAGSAPDDGQSSLYLWNGGGWTAHAAGMSVYALDRVRSGTQFVVALGRRTIATFDASLVRSGSSQLPATAAFNATGRIGGLLTTSTACHVTTLEPEPDGGRLCRIRNCAVPDAGLYLPTGYGICGAMWEVSPSTVNLAVDLDVFRIDVGDATAYSTADAAVTLVEPAWAASALADGGGWLVGENLSTMRLGGSPGGQVDRAGVEYRRAEVPLLAVWASPDGGSWAVGRSGVLASETPAGAFSWRSHGTTMDLFALSISPEGVAIAGQEGLLWAPGDQPRLGPGNTIRDLWRADAGTWYFATESGRVSRWQPGATTTTQLEYQDGGSPLNGLFGLAPDDIHAVGEPCRIVSYDGRGWRESKLDGGFELWKVHGRDGRLWAVGSDLTLLERPGPGRPWQLLTSDSNSTTLYGVWMESADAGLGWAVGGGGEVRRISNGSLDRTPQAAIARGSLFDVWGFDGDDVWAVGDQGAVFHFTGQAWQAVESGTRNQLERVRGRRYPDGSRELFIVGLGGTVLRYRYAWPP